MIPITRTRSYFVVFHKGHMAVVHSRDLEGYLRDGYVIHYQGTQAECEAYCEDNED